jgi:hypothetical protein
VRNEVLISEDVQRKNIALLKEREVMLDDLCRERTHRVKCLAIRGDTEVLYLQEVLQKNCNMSDPKINVMLTMLRAPGRKE